MVAQEEYNKDDDVSRVSGAFGFVKKAGKKTGKGFVTVGKAVPKVGQGLFVGLLGGTGLDQVSKGPFMLYLGGILLLFIGIIVLRVRAAAAKNKAQ